MKKNEIIVLGSGTSTGTPIATCSCEVCHSSDLKDTRLRSSILIQAANGQNILIDTTPDFRTQCLREGIKKIDSVIITHAHADHCHGIDDLRPFCFSTPPKYIDIYTSNETAQELVTKFDYIFNSRPQNGGGIPLLSLKPIEWRMTQKICDEDFIFFPLPHGHLPTVGFRLGSFAYCIDCHDIPDDVLPLLSDPGLDLLIIDCVRHRPHGTHLHFEKTIDLIHKIKPQRAGLIHMNHDLSHQWLEKTCRQYKDIDIFPLYDQMRLEF